MDSSSWKDNPIETRTWMIVGVMPYQNHIISINLKKSKTTELYIKHSLARNDDLRSYYTTWCLDKTNQKVGQLDSKQYHTRFDYDEYDRSKPAPGAQGFDLPVYAEDLEHDQGRHESVYGQGHHEACQGHQMCPLRSYDFPF